MKRFLVFIAAAMLALASATSKADVIVDNYLTETNGAEAGAVGNFRMQSFTPNIAGLGVQDTVGANSPLPATVFLNSVTFLSAISAAGGNDGPGQAFIDVYEGLGDGGTYLGSSLNSNDITGAVGSVNPFTWDFGSLAINSALEHTFVFSNDNVQGDPRAVRLQVARDAGGSFGSSYDGGVASLFSNGDSPTAFDVRFQVDYSLTAVPEPTSLTVLGICGLVFASRRRRD